MSCKGHFMVKTETWGDPHGRHCVVISRFGKVRAVHIDSDSDDHRDICLTGAELLFWVKGIVG